MERNRTATMLLAAGSVSAGVHAALAPEHLHEWLPLGVAFVAAAAVLGITVAALALSPSALWPARVLGALLAGTIAAYALTRIAALPPFDPEQEPLDTLGLATKVVEAGGLVLALRISRLPLHRGGTP
jgi:hypothetical protein